MLPRPGTDHVAADDMAQGDVGVRLLDLFCWLFAIFVHDQYIAAALSSRLKKRGYPTTEKLQAGLHSTLTAGRHALSNGRCGWNFD
jgi:hypothetical protein